MSKRVNKKSDADMRSDYDFSHGTRGKHARDYIGGHTVKIYKSDGGTVVQHYKLEEGAVVLAPDVREYFCDADSVNRALRTLIELIPQKRRRTSGK
jgi:hypothetical protein